MRNYQDDLKLCHDYRGFPDPPGPIDTWQSILKQYINQCIELAAENKRLRDALANIASYNYDRRDYDPDDADYMRMMAIKALQP